VRAIDEFDECEPAGAAGLAIDRQHDLRRRRHRAEVGAQISFGGAVGKITDEQADGQSISLYVVEDEAGKRGMEGHTRWQPSFFWKNLT
jgi:hypothetical protein